MDTRWHCNPQRRFALVRSTVDFDRTFIFSPVFRVTLSFMKRPLVFGAIVVLTALCVWLWQRPMPNGEMPPLIPRTRTAALILAGAKSQIGDAYDANYRTIAFPGGDVKPGRGACTDVVVRALRKGGYDLQALMHADMKQNFGAYPRNWGLTKPNTDIDHRRVPNQMTFLRRHGRELSPSVRGAALKQWQPGDVVYWNSSGTLRQMLHTGIVSNRRNARGIPFVIHNGWQCVEQDDLTRWPIIGHFRFPAKAPR
jgi:hypothetical protein